MTKIAFETNEYVVSGDPVRPSEASPETVRTTAQIDHERDEDGLFVAFAALADASEAGRFLRDIATPSEIKSFEERWRIARLLDEGVLSYRAIAKRTGASTTTVARVARFLKEENNNGYRVMIDRLQTV